MLKLVLEFNQKQAKFFMNKQKIFLFTILSIFLLFFVAKPIFATSAPVMEEEKNIDFNGWAINESKTTANVDSGSLTLPKSNGLYNNSAVAWTNTIGFYEDIKAIKIKGDFVRPSGTNVFCYVTYGDELKENKVAWGREYEPTTVTEDIKVKIFLSTNDRNVTPVVNNINIQVKLQDRSDSAPEKRDRDRVYDLSKVKEILNRYHNDFGHYPIVRTNKTHKEDQWRMLKDILESASEHRLGHYLWGFVDQVSGVSSDYKYGYLSNGSYYLLWTTLEQGVFHSDYFEDSWRGSRFGVDCSEPRYCLYSVSSNVSNVSDQSYIYEPDNNNQNLNNNQDQYNNVNFEGTSFVKGKNSDKVYLKINGKRVWMRNPDIFHSLGGKWHQLQERRHLFSSLAKFVKSPSEPDVYMIQDGLKRPLLNPDVLHLYGNFGEVMTLDEALIEALPSTKLLRAKGHTRVWYIDDNVKRWIHTPDVLRDMGYSFSQVVEVNPEELKHYQQGETFF